jgi:hypothetical protein
MEVLVNASLLHRNLPLLIVKVIDKTIDWRTIIIVTFMKQGIRVWSGLNWLKTR